MSSFDPKSLPIPPIPPAPSAAAEQPQPAAGLPSLATAEPSPQLSSEPPPPAGLPMPAPPVESPPADTGTAEGSFSPPYPQSIGDFSIGVEVTVGGQASTRGTVTKLVEDAHNPCAWVSFDSERHPNGWKSLKDLVLVDQSAEPAALETQGVEHFRDAIALANEIPGLVTNPSALAPTVAGLPVNIPPPTVVTPDVTAVTPPVTHAVSTIPVQSQSSSLQSINLVGLEDELSLDLDAVLRPLDCVQGGPSRGGFSWSTLSEAQKCWRRAYFSLVLGLQKNSKSRALLLGSLVHACMEAHYRTGGAQTRAPIDAVQAAGAADLAAEAYRLVWGQLSKYAADEVQTWDIRDVECQGTMFLDPVQIGRRKVFIPLTCRHDLVVAVKTAGTPDHPKGQPVPHGCHIVDWKTAARLSYDLTKGYSMDPQFLMNALIYTRAEMEKFGPLAGIIISIMVKHKHLDPDKSFWRISTNYDESLVNEFLKEEIQPLAVQLYTRLVDKDIRSDMHRWPKCHSSCATGYICPYFDICDTPIGGEDAVITNMFKVDESRIIDVEKFAQPPKITRARAGKTPEQIEEQQQKRDAARSEREAAKMMALATFVAAAGQTEQLKPAVWLTAESKKSDVLKALAEYIARLWEVGSKIPIQAIDGSGEVVYTVTAKGVIWQYDGKKSTFAWSTLAKAVSMDWWNPAASTPTAAPE